MQSCFADSIKFDGLQARDKCTRGWWACERCTHLTASLSRCLVSVKGEHVIFGLAGAEMAGSGWRRWRVVGLTSRARDMWRACCYAMLTNINVGDMGHGDFMDYGAEANGLDALLQQIRQPLNAKLDIQC